MNLVSLSRPILAAIALLAISNQAVAQDEPAPATAPPAKGTAAKAKSTTPTEPSDATPPAGDKAPASSLSVGPFERLPDSAYPSKPLRGLYGGSLWSTFHGLQWPYYPKTGIGVSGYVWIDTGYEHLQRGDPAEPSYAYMLQQGRLVLRVTPTWSDGAWFVQGQAEIVGNKDQSVPPSAVVQTDDVWVRLGKWNTFDIQAGRYEGWEVYHFGMGLDLYTLERQGASDQNPFPFPAIYGVTYAMYRPDTIGQAALHLYPTEYLRFELGAEYGNTAGLNGFAGRPVVVFDLGWMKAKAGFEYLQLAQQQDGAKEEKKQFGYGGSLQFIVDPYVEFGLNGARGSVDHVSPDGTHDDRGSYTQSSVGAFLNARIVSNLLVGGGIDYTFLVDQQYDSKLRRFEDFDHWQGFGAVQYKLWDQLFLKAVYGQALANFNPNNGALVYTNEMKSFRLRLSFLF